MVQGDFVEFVSIVSKYTSVKQFIYSLAWKPSLSENVQHNLNFGMKYTKVGLDLASFVAINDSGGFILVESPCISRGHFLASILPSQFKINFEIIHNVFVSKTANLLRYFSCIYRITYIVNAFRLRVDLIYFGINFYAFFEAQ